MIPRFLRRLFNEVNERRLGIHTNAWIPPEQLGFSGTGPYGPSPWLVLAHVFRTQRVSKEDVFVDYGSGMGRALIFAARQPFKRLIGVEHSEELNRLARDNIERSRNRVRCKDIEVVTADAKEWRVPEDVTFVYLFAPFPPEVFERVIRQLLASIDRRPRTVRLVYYFMSLRDREVITTFDRVRPIEFKTPMHLRKRLSELWMYELLPETVGADENAG